MVVAKPPRKECACISEEQQEGLGVEMCEWGQNGKRWNQRGKAQDGGDGDSLCITLQTTIRILSFVLNEIGRHLA